VQKLEDLLKSCAFKDLLKEAMTSIGWHCTTWGPNLHVVQAHLERSSTTLRVVILRIIHMVRQFQRNSRSLTPHEFQQCLPHPLVPRKDKVYHKFLLGIVSSENFASKVDFNDDINDFLTPITQSRLKAPCKGIDQLRKMLTL
jgi:hypothetical protein